MKKETIFGISETAVSLLLTIGSFTFLSACGIHEGKYMACHWAQNTITLLGIILTVQSVARLILKDRARIGLSLSIFTLAVSAVLIPGTVINLCMMETMRCHTIFRPAVFAIGIILALISGADAVTAFIKSGRENEHQVSAA
ncbi:MAG: DUF4418 family protein [Oscillospiraceae bacterium]|nr:DUF4418 family protein [Oscillospiraceae bacterium]